MPFRVMLTFVPEIIPNTFDATELDVSIMQAKKLENKPGQLTLKGFWRYRKDLFEKKTIVQMAENLQCMLESTVSNQEQTIDDLPLKHLPEWKKECKKQKKRKNQH